MNQVVQQDIWDYWINATQFGRFAYPDEIAERLTILSASIKLYIRK